MQITLLTTAEEQLMHLFWKLKTFYLKDVMEQHPEPKPHQNTISTYLKILVEKQFLKTEKEGRIFKYSVVVPIENYRNFLLQNLLVDYFHNQPSEIIKSLLDQKILKPSDFSHFIEVKTKVIPIVEEPKKDNAVSDFIKELTSKKKGKKKKKKEKKHKK